MRRLFFLLLALLSMICAVPVHSQLMKRAGEFLSTALEDGEADSLADTPGSIEERIRRDSLRLHEMTLQLQEMKLKEITLNAQLNDATGRNHKADSIKKA